MQRVPKETRGKGTRSPLFLLQMICCGIFCLWAVLGSLPTGWMYDIGVGEGTGQGQWPGSAASRITRQEEVEGHYRRQSPATVRGGCLVGCPLLRLRDVEWKGEHQTRARRVRRTVHIAEYQVLDSPPAWWQELLRIFAIGGAYNRYFLMGLPDGSYVCVYFDDYILLKNRLQKEGIYPTGYVRQATAQERQMLEGMAQEYEVDPGYVLDMYRHGKMSGNIDLLVRFVFAFLGACVLCFAAGFLRSWLMGLKQPQ